jgi:hypothetical protein
MEAAMRLSEEEYEIIELWKKGWTGTQIAKKMYMTRNAVMGKLFRWRKAGLFEYKSTATRKAAIKEKVRIENRKLALGKGKPRSTVKKEFPLINYLDNLPPPPPLTEPVKFMDLSPQSCRYVVSGGVTKDFRFCNLPKKDGSSYCTDHHKLCYVPMSAPKYKVKRNATTA